MTSNSVYNVYSLNFKIVFQRRSFYIIIITLWMNCITRNSPHEDPSILIQNCSVIATTDLDSNSSNFKELLWEAMEGLFLFCLALEFQSSFWTSQYCQCLKLGCYICSTNVKLLFWYGLLLLFEIRIFWCTFITG